MIETKTVTENAYLLFPVYDKRDDFGLRLDELTRLCESAGVNVLGYDVQYVREINPATVFGSGKLEEIKNKISSLDVDVIVYDGTLNPSRTQNLSNFFDGIKLIDRTTLILDIFALRATTAEGKLQVELAQLEYLLPRLKGQGKALSRLGGGVGTRGPGETKLETDRRYIRGRINSLKKSLEELKSRRKLISDRRKKNQTPTVALAGYTNAGKSTLLNRLSGSNVLSEDKLFATLDPTARKVKLNGFTIILIDTVGFIRDIPTNLIEAFKSTLSAVCDADLILNVCDASGDYANQLAVTDKLLEELHPTAQIIKVYNKADKISDFINIPSDGVIISASQGIGIDELLNKIETALGDGYQTREISINHSKLGKFYKIAYLIDDYELTYLDDGVKIKYTVKKSNLDKFNAYLNSKD